MPRIIRSRTTALLLLSVAGSGCGDDEATDDSVACDDGQCPGALLCVANVCVDPDWEPGQTSGATDPTDDSDASETSGPTEPVDEVDVLFVIDNSGSMGEEQANVSANLGAFLDPLVTAGFDVRVAVTTTDDGNYWCNGPGTSDPESGQFVLSSCRSRLGDFQFNGAPPVDAETACTDFCSLDTLETQPTTTAQDSTPRPRPWIELNSQGNNLPSGVTPTLAMQCIIPQGINGCGFESTLESMRKALLRTSDQTRDEYGFVRDGAHLAVVLISDEADCSFNRGENDSVMNTVFGEEGVGNQVFWSMPEDQQTPTSAVCWNAGVSCDFSLDADQCSSVDLDVDGNSTDDASLAALHPLDRYRADLEALRSEKLAVGADVFTFGIVGVGTGYASTGIVNYSPTNPADDPNFVINFGVGPGCVSNVAAAVPPVRLREFAEDSPWSSTSQLFSVCDTSYAPALESIASTIIGGTP